MMMALMIEAVSTSEISVNFYQTARRNNPEDCHLHAGRHTNVNNPSWKVTDYYETVV
jgi:hypothetical protein